MTRQVIAIMTFDHHAGAMSDHTDTIHSTDTTQTTPTADPDTGIDRLVRTIDTYLAAYCEPDPVRRAELVAVAWRPTGSLLDPPFDATGHADVAALTDIVLTHYPDHRFARTTVVDAHHGIARYGWQLIGPDGAVAVGGVDVAEFADDGRLTRVVGFFGPLVDLPS
jgi:hypothetical protein